MGDVEMSQGVKGKLLSKMAIWEDPEHTPSMDTPNQCYFRTIPPEEELRPD